MRGRGRATEPGGRRITWAAVLSGNMDAESEDGEPDDWTRRRPESRRRSPFARSSTAETTYRQSLQFPGSRNQVNPSLLGRASEPGEGRHTSAGILRGEDGEPDDLTQQRPESTRRSPFARSSTAETTYRQSLQFPGSRNQNPASARNEVRQEGGEQREARPSIVNFNLAPSIPCVESVKDEESQQESRCLASPDKSDRNLDPEEKSDRSFIQNRRGGFVNSGFSSHASNNRLRSGGRYFGGQRGRNPRRSGGGYERSDASPGGTSLTYEQQQMIRNARTTLKKTAICMVSALRFKTMKELRANRPGLVELFVTDTDFRQCMIHHTIKDDSPLVGSELLRLGQMVKLELQRIKTFDTPEIKNDELEWEVAIAASPPEILALDEEYCERGVKGIGPLLQSTTEHRFRMPEYIVLFDSMLYKLGDRYGVLKNDIQKKGINAGLGTFEVSVFPNPDAGDQIPWVICQILAFEEPPREVESPRIVNTWSMVPRVLPEVETPREPERYNMDRHTPSNLRIVASYRAEHMKKEEPTFDERAVYALAVCDAVLRTLVLRKFDQKTGYEMEKALEVAAEMLVKSRETRAGYRNSIRTARSVFMDLLVNTVAKGLFERGGHGELFREMAFCKMTTDIFADPHGR